MIKKRVDVRQSSIDRKFRAWVSLHPKKLGIILSPNIKVITFINVCIACEFTKRQCLKLANLMLQKKNYNSP